LNRAGFAAIASLNRPKSLGLFPLSSVAVFVLEVKIRAGFDSRQLTVTEKRLLDGQ